LIYQAVSGFNRVCYDAGVRQLGLAIVVVALTAAPVFAADALSEARRLYNQGQYDAAEQAARDAARTPAAADSARVVLGRILLERYRRTPAAADLSNAIATLRAVDTSRLDTRERIELTIGFAEALYLDDRFGAAADMFESVLDDSEALGTPAHERVLDWWATSVDRQAQSRPVAEREEIYGRVSARMAAEIAKDAGSTPAGYWLAASARGSGDAERALDLATAAWVRAVLARDGGVALRADLDRLVSKGILPDRAARLSVRDHNQALAGMIAEWDAFKASWAR
jgi:tetratricopeptide (TPR) repeat protein